WQDHFISRGDNFIPFMTSSDALVVRAAPGAAPRDYAGLLGIASMTAYAGMACLAECVPGDTVVVSSGAGTVGSVACQIALIKGLRVVTSAGTDEKVAWLRREIGVHEAFNYRTAGLADALARACPNGIDLVLENASPEHLSACLPLMNELRQILISGFVSIYNTGGKVPPFENFEYVLDRFLTVRAYRFMDCLEAYDRFVADMLAWRAAGKMVFREIVFEGLEAAPEAFCALLRGDVTGKGLVRLSDA
ncbi:NADP-dependent oxidoreductase, partial [Phenylobacterium sp.]|uniref:NADP-dependent oxidoreductase n=1 Tax=Phenylobacterium sp. TaxID=1871053 RepID=UPI00286D39E0